MKVDWWGLGKTVLFYLIYGVIVFLSGGTVGFMMCQRNIANWQDSKYVKAQYKTNDDLEELKMLVRQMPECVAHQLRQRPRPRDFGDAEPTLAPEVDQ